MRLCLLILAADNTHQCKPEAEPGRWRRGEIVDVFDADRRAMVGDDPHPKFLRVYITDWPGTLERARDILLRPHTHSTELDDLDKPRMIGRRKRVVPVGILPLGARRKLRDERYLEVTTAQARDAIRRRIPDVESRLQSDETALADDEVIG